MVVDNPVDADAIDGKPVGGGVLGADIGDI